MPINVRLANVTDAAACSHVLCASIRELCFEDHRGDSAHIASWTANKTPETIATWIASGAYTLRR